VSLFLGHAITFSLYEIHNSSVFVFFSLCVCVCVCVSRGRIGVHHLPRGNFHVARFDLLGDLVLHHVADSGHRQLGESHILIIIIIFYYDMCSAGRT